MNLIIKNAKNIIRYAVKSLSMVFFYFNTKTDRKKERLILDDINKLLKSKNLNLKASNKTKTHQEFSQNVFNLIRKKN